MNESLRDRLRRRKVVQWTLAYAASAWVLLQVLDLLSEPFGWPAFVLRASTLVLVVGLLAVLVIAWYHGEKGAQRVSTVELIMLAGILTIAGAALALVQRGESEGPATRDAGATPTSVLDSMAIAVLPFANLSVDRSNEYFADGITDDILTSLSRIHGLRVISRTSIMQFKDANKGVPAIAAELGVAHVLEGTVRRDGDQVRITAQLIDARTDRHVWAESYDRELRGIFEIQSEIAGRIAEALEARLSPEDQTHIAAGGTTDITAYDLYLRGREYLYQPGTERTNIDAAIALFRRALELDPAYAHAMAGLGRAYTLHPGLAPATRRDSALGIARRAVARDPQLAAARVALADAFMLTAQFEVARTANEQVLDLDPSNADAMGNLGDLAFRESDFATALRWYQHAVANDPTTGIRYNALAWVYFVVGDLDRAEAHYRRHLDLSPEAPGSRGNIAVIRILRDDTAGADAEMRQLETLAAGRIHALRTAAMVAARRSQWERARQLLQEHAGRSPEETLHISLAFFELMLGNRASAIQLATRAERELDAVADPMARDWYRAEIAALRGQNGQAIGLLRRLYDRGWRDYWLVDSPGDTRLNSGLITTLLGSEPAFQTLTARMRQDLDARRAGLQ
ncbi:MAG: tetratricopeptide repeat protein [Gemmatimonadetes bacterium]|nr:tetratricopeptide repeat protein [Gemmatimonadota bacterium]